MVIALLPGSKSLGGIVMGGVSWRAIVWGAVVQEEIVIEPILNTIKSDLEFVIGKLYSKQIVKTRYYSYQVFLFFLLIWVVSFMCLGARLFVFVNQIFRGKGEEPSKFY